MAEVILYIAASLDGFIAKEDGGIDWLSELDSDDTDYGYKDFYESIDALLIGSKTYEQVLTFGDWPYPGKPSYVFTRRALTTEREDVFFVSGNPGHVMADLKAQGPKRFWLMGGAGLIAEFMRENLIDEYMISIIPVILGGGIPLFVSGEAEEKLSLVKSQEFSTGLVQVTYRKKH